jgi:hypothetical protein
MLTLIAFDFYFSISYHMQEHLSTLTKCTENDLEDGSEAKYVA